MGKRTVSTLSLTDSLLNLDSTSGIPGGTTRSPNTLADDIFNDPQSWEQGPELVEEDNNNLNLSASVVAQKEKGVQKEKDKEKRTVNREASVFLDKPLSGLLSLTPKATRPEFKLKSLKDSAKYKSAPRPIKLSLNGDNLHQWDMDEPSRKSTRTARDFSKRMTRLFSQGLRCVSPGVRSSKPSPLDAPVSAADPYTPPHAAATTKRFSFHSPSGLGNLSAGLTASATWNILQFYSEAPIPKTASVTVTVLPAHRAHGPATPIAGLPPKPHSARPKIPPVPKMPPPSLPSLPSTPAKKKTFPKVAMPPTPMKFTVSGQAKSITERTPVTPSPMSNGGLKTASTATLTPLSTAGLKTSSTLVATPSTATPSSTISTSSKSAARRPLPTIPTGPAPLPPSEASYESGAGAGLSRSKTTHPRSNNPPLLPTIPTRAKSEVHPRSVRRALPSQPSIPIVN